MVLKRIKTLAEMLSKNNDEKGIKLLLDSINGAIDYNNAVVRMESRLATEKFRLEPEDFRDLTMELDRHRRIAHDALLSSCTAFNRYLKKEYPGQYPEGGIFGMPKASLVNFDRHTAGDWAGELVHELFVNRQIRRTAHVRSVRQLIRR